VKMRIVIAGGTLCVALVAAHVETGRAVAAAKDRARIAFSKELPPLEGAHLKATLVEVNYGPGEASSPHSHPCAVVGYVVEGSLRTQVKGEPQTTYRAGESFYEPPNGIHLVSANASFEKPAKFVAFLICDHDTPLSVEIPR